jgi:hypothetical protein
MNAAQSRSVSLRVSARIDWWVRPYISFMLFVQRRGIPVDARSVARTARTGVHTAIEVVPREMRVDVRV